MFYAVDPDVPIARLSPPPSDAFGSVNGRAIENYVRQYHELNSHELELVRSIGIAWDGKSDLVFPRRTIPAASAARLLSVVRRGLKSLGDPLINMPTASSLRWSVQVSYEQPLVVIEVDVGGAVLPFSDREMAFYGADSERITQFAEDIVRHVRVESRHRESLAKRDARTKLLFNEVLAKIGHRARLLWLRMHPLPAEDSRAQSRSQTFDWCFEILDDHLDPALVGSVRSNPGEARDHGIAYAMTQRRRSKIRDAVEAADALCAMDPVALALAELNGLSPQEACLSLARKVQSDTSAVRSLQFESDNSTPGALYFIDGVIRAAISFDGGRYNHNVLILTGTLPAIVIDACIGERLGKIVDHPAFANTNARVRGTTLREDWVELGLSSNHVLIGKSAAYA